MERSYRVQCDCERIALQFSGEPRVRAYCHCKECRELLQVPFHSVVALEPTQLVYEKGELDTREFFHPTRKMSRVFCQHCGEVLFNTNAHGWRLLSQHLIRKSNDGELPEELQAQQHFFYAERVIDIDDDLPK